MSPEFGATSTLFPIDDETLAYLRLTGRSAERVDLVERYAKEQGLWREPGAGPGLRRAARARPRERRPVGRRAAPAAGPRAARRPRGQLPVELPERPRRPIAEPAASTRRRRRRRGGSSAESFPASRPAVVHPADDVEARSPPADPVGARDAGRWTRRAYRPVDDRGRRPAVAVRTGSVAIAAITSCTNTSNPTVMVGAGLLARNAVARGLRVGPTVKTSLAPGLARRHRAISRRPG